MSYLNFAVLKTSWAFKNNSAKANWPGVRAVIVLSFNILQCKKDFFRIREILPNLPVLPFLPNPFYSRHPGGPPPPPLLPKKSKLKKKSESALARWTYAEIFQKPRDSPTLPLKSLLRQGLSEPDFYGDLVYKLKKIVGSNNFSAQFIKIISHYKKIGYNIKVLQQTACLVVNPITVGNFAFLFNCNPVGRTSDSMMVPT